MVTFNFSAVHTRIESKTCFRLPPSAFLKMAFFLWLIFELGSDSIKRSHDPSRNQWDCSIVHLTGLHQLWPRYTVLAECTWSSKGGKKHQHDQACLAKTTHILHLKNPAKTLTVYSAVVLLYGTGLYCPALRGNQNMLRAWDGKEQTE